MNFRYYLFILFLFTISQADAQQHYLYKRISVSAKNKRLEDVLDSISKSGNFIFSYSGSVLNKDSLVSVSARDQQVRDVLDNIFHGKVDYKEIDNYIILRSSMLRFSIIPDQMTINNRISRISGFVVDEQTGRKVSDASVYEKHLLRSTLTDKDGYFNLRFRGENKSVVLTVSKDAYRDTSMLFLAGLTVNQEGYVEPEGEEEARTISSLVERLGLARFLVTSRQRIQSINLAGLIVNAPFQASLIPGISSHGMMSSQIVNKGSLNLIGGYTAGVKGFEIAGVFNLGKGDVQHFQVAGLSNIVGGSATGFQAAGLMNAVLDSLTGFQAAGLINNVRYKVSGFQASGIVNRDKSDVSGFQASGLSNLVSGSFSGMQVAGLVNKVSGRAGGAQIAALNYAKDDLNGMQIGLINYAKRLKGFQIGLINVTDTSGGFSLGLINFNRKGYHKISISANEVINTNLSLKLGNANLYTIFLAGMNIRRDEKVYSGGLGLGHDFFASKRVSLATELTSGMLYLGSKDGTNLLNRFQTSLQVNIINGIRLFAGPVYSVYFSNAATPPTAGYKENIAPARAHAYTSTSKGWLGWNAGITLF